MENENFNNLKMMMDIKVPMSDGICLSTNIYLPKDNLSCPIILQRSPYGTNTEEMVKEAVNFVKEGYGAVLQDVRGRWDSDGEWYPFINEASDGYDTQEWIGKQDWCVCVASCIKFKKYGSIHSFFSEELTQSLQV